MNEIKLAQESLRLVRTDFGLEGNITFEPDGEPFERLLDFLEIRISDMLDRDFAGLLNALYRIDVNEEEIKKILSDENSELIARQIASAVINRQRQKVITRQHYDQP